MSIGDVESNVFEVFFSLGECSDAVISSDMVDDSNMLVISVIVTEASKVVSISDMIVGGQIVVLSSVGVNSDVSSFCNEIVESWTVFDVWAAVDCGVIVIVETIVDVNITDAAEALTVLVNSLVIVVSDTVISFNEVEGSDVVVVLEAVETAAVEVVVEAAFVVTYNVNTVFFIDVSVSLAVNEI